MLSEEQLRDYERDGFVLVRGLITAEEADVLRTESHDLIGRLSDASDPTWASAGSSPAVLPTSLQHSHDVQFYSAAFSRMLVDSGSPTSPVRSSARRTCNCTTRRCS